MLYHYWSNFRHNTDLFYFTVYVLNNSSNASKCSSSEFLNIDKQVENTRRSRVVLTSLSVRFSKSENEHFRVFELASQTHRHFERKSRLKLAKFGCNFPDF